MKREYHKWSSPALGRDMEMLVFGHAGMPVMVFPSSCGRFFEFEDRGMVMPSTTSSNTVISSSTVSTRSTPKAGTTAPFLRAGASRVNFSTRNI